MPEVDAIIQYGEISDIRMLDEPYLLVQHLDITPSREKEMWKGGNLAVQALRYSNPILTFSYNAILSEVAGLGNMHPGSLVTELNNYEGELFGFDPEEGILVFEDPVRTMTLEDPAETDFNVVQYPFLGSHMQWSDGTDVLWGDGGAVT